MPGLGEVDSTLFIYQLKKHSKIMCKRCDWVSGQFPEYIKYHDEEWGMPVHDDKKHFEFLILEGAQAGLSWSTILKRREGYRAAFADFDVQEVANFDEKRLDALLLDKGIIRNKLKVYSARTNALAFMKVQQEFGTFDKYIWSFVGHKPVVKGWKKMSQIPATTSESDALSKDLKKRGFKFVGSTIIYAHMQACGLVNDHTTDCFRYQEIIDGY
jgi:DNA-3-methyladenine glycosylase I